MRVWVLSAACLASASLLPNPALSFTPQHAPALRTVAGGVQCSARGTDAGVAADPAARLRRAVGAPLVVAVGTAIALTSPLSVIADVAAPPAPVFRLAAITLPDDWSVATTEDGKEYYYNTKTKQSQWAPPTGAKDSAAMKKKKNQQNNLNEVIRFDAQPTVQVDRVTVNEPVALPEGCGEGDFRANSVECGQPAKPLPIDVAEKAAGAIGALQDSNAGKEKAAAADTRYRMLQEAEMKALANTDLFKRLDAQTKDPERVKQRASDIEAITIENDEGSRIAPWARPDDPYPPAKLELPKLKIPSWVPFIGSKEDAADEAVVEAGADDAAVDAAVAQ